VGKGRALLGLGRFADAAGRYRAALEVGLPELPCVVREASDAETMEIALVEKNRLSHRAAAFRALADALGGLPQ